MTVVVPDPSSYSPAPLPEAAAEQIRRFHKMSRFAETGGVVTDLDGTAVHERAGRVYVVEPVAEGLKALVEQGRPVVLNTLRFPLNVIRTFGREWSAITDEPIPLVSLNGATIGLLKPTDEGETTFDEVVSFPAPDREIEEMIEALKVLLHEGVEDIVLFHYARDWRLGETIWTPREERRGVLAAKYLSASQVICVPLDALCDRLKEQGVCMLSLIVDIPEDKRMAYQHGNPSRFVTAPGISKLSGAHEAAKRFGFDLGQSVGAGDTPMDSFLAGVGLAIHVGPMQLQAPGLIETVRLRDPMELGAALFALAGLQRATA